jgi:uncharacterized membrane protein
VPKRPLTLALAGMLAGGVAAASVSVMPLIPVPVSPAGLALGVNNRGDVVGIQFDYPVQRAFRWSRQGIEYFEYPGAVFTEGSDINTAGDIVGSYATADGDTVGFLRTRHGRFSTIEVPGALSTSPRAINNSLQIVGSFMELTPWLDESWRGFLIDRRGTLRVLNHPFASPGSPGSQTFPAAINEAGVIVGSFGGSEGDDPWHGFILRDETWTIVDYPGADQTFLTGIASNGQVVGYANFLFSEGPSRGFLYRDEVFEDLPLWLYPTGINASGLIVGFEVGAGRAVMTCVPARPVRACGP